MSEAHANWIAGAECPSASGASFELRRGEPARSFGTWPYSDVADVEHAFAALSDAGGQWSRWDPSERVRCLGLAVGELVARESTLSVVARFLGVEAIELEALARPALERCERLLAHASSAARRPGIAVVLSHWSDLIGGLGETILPELAAGRSVLLFVDPRLPIAAEPWRVAFDEVGLLPGALAIVHGPSRAAIEAAVATQGVLSLRARGSEVELAGLYRVARSAEGVRAELKLLRNRSERVRANADVGAAARRVVEGAFGRATTLSGQLDGQVGRVLCHEHVFSAFTDALLAELGRSPDAARPVALIDDEALGALRTTLELGLDEGATLIHGGQVGGRSRTVAPSVFTNVEADSQLARRTEPAPVLCLLRVASDRAGDDLIEDLG